MICWEEEVMLQAMPTDLLKKENNIQSGNDIKGLGLAHWWLFSSYYSGMATIPI